MTSPPPPSNSPGAFRDPDIVARCAEGPARLVPGFADLHRMSTVLLAETLENAAELLILGAGGGLELRAFAEIQPGWRFVGVDPSAEMLDLAARTIGSHIARMQLCRGTIDSAPPGPFDGATCLLTLHFMPLAERLPTLRALHQRLKPGAPLVVAHHSFPQGEGAKDIWLGRYAAFATASGVSADKALAAARKIGTDLPILSPQDDEVMLRAAGFSDVCLFFGDLTCRGWIACAA